MLRCRKISARLSAVLVCTLRSHLAKFTAHQLLPLVISTTALRMIEIQLDCHILSDLTRVWNILSSSLDAPSPQDQ